MKRKRDRSESGQLRNKINRWVRFLSKERDWDYVFMLGVSPTFTSNVTLR